MGYIENGNWATGSLQIVIGKK